jgi:hypothetical protein
MASNQADFSDVVGEVKPVISKSYILLTKLSEEMDAPAMEAAGIDSEQNRQSILDMKPTPSHNLRELALDPTKTDELHAILSGINIGLVCSAQTLHLFGTG